MAAAPLLTYSEASQAGLRFSRRTPREGEARLTSAMTDTPSPRRARPKSRGLGCQDILSRSASRGASSLRAFDLGALYFDYLPENVRESLLSVIAL